MSARSWTRSAVSVKSCSSPFHGIPRCNNLTTSVISRSVRSPAPCRRTHQQRRLAQDSRAYEAETKSQQARSTAVVEHNDPFNPPKTTLPPQLTEVKRGSENVFAYLWKIARAYGSFYKSGGKAIFTNRRLAKQVRERLRQKIQPQSGFDPFELRLIEAASKAGVLRRSDFQLLRRNGYDMVRLPIFGVLIAIMGEWLPLLVPFMPYAVPLTCRIPSQVEGMRKKTEQRRSLLFRQGIGLPEKEQIQIAQTGASWGLLDRAHTRQVLQALRSEQLWYLSCVLNLHSRMWETIQQRPPSWMMRRRLANKLHYLAQDDLLLNTKGNAAKALEEQELLIACEERGLDVLGPSTIQLENQLAGWLRRQKEDRGRGAAVLHMLFRRPNAW